MAETSTPYLYFPPPPATYLPPIASNNMAALYAQHGVTLAWLLAAYAIAPSARRPP